MTPETAPDNPWFLYDAIQLIERIEAVCPNHGCHVALTGGVLYKHGGRKDLDILFYRIRQAARIDLESLFSSLEQMGFSRPEGLGWCYKTSWEGKGVDLFFPELDGGIYTQEVTAGDEPPG